MPTEHPSVLLQFLYGTALKKLFGGVVSSWTGTFKLNLDSKNWLKLEERKKSRKIQCFFPNIGEGIPSKRQQ